MKQDSLGKKWHLKEAEVFQYRSKQQTISRRTGMFQVFIFDQEHGNDSEKTKKLYTENNNLI